MRRWGRGGVLAGGWKGEYAQVGGQLSGRPYSVAPSENWASARLAHTTRHAASLRSSKNCIA